MSKNMGAPQIRNFMQACVMLEKTRVPDGVGGSKIVWKDGAHFDAAIIKDRLLAAREAERQGVTEVYTVTTAEGVGLEFHEAFRRLSDGAVFRATSNYTDSKPPKGASFAFEQVNAERWELPK